MDVNENHVDCGEIVYKIIEDEFQGGSGAGCSAVVLGSYIYDKLRRGGRIGKVLFAATGALLSTVLFGAGREHPLHLPRRRDRTDGHRAEHRKTFLSAKG